MNKRPQRTDSEQDILEMQRAFLAEKAKNAKFQPSAQVVKVKKEEKQSIFAKTRNLHRGIAQKQTPNSPLNFVLGDIIEKSVGGNSSEKSSPAPSEDVGFPKVERVKVTKPIKGKSLFAQSLERKRQQENQSESNNTSAKVSKQTFGEQSVLVNDDETAKSIHKENVELLSEMSPQEILEERKKLLESMDPGIVQFLVQKRKNHEFHFKSKLQTCNEKETSEIPMIVDEESPVDEILNRDGSEKWIHFDVIEKDKLEWMKEVPMQMKKMKSGEKFEARFDWKGVLLPYTDKNDEKDDRDLYMHGDEPHRPGYTLQELFRLARSNVIQQRISAYGAIAGILNIYSQGFYDNVLDLPISKIFFLLRFGFDENSLTILEVVSKALSIMFYNDTDETILDFVTETPEGFLQPIMEVENCDVNDDREIETSLKNLNLESSPFTTFVQETGEESKTSMDDFQLAETDLIECLLRTNIVQRISYILGNIRPENSTVTSCMKILIRIARTNKDAAIKIISHNELMNILFKEFVPGLHQIGNKDDSCFYGFPQHLVLKLLRILMSQQLSICLKLISMNLVEHLKSYLFTREDMKAKLIRVQIEALRIVRNLMLLKPDVQFYRELVPAFRYMLERHFQNIIYEQGGPFLLRQHASALLAAISSGPLLIDAKTALCEALSICGCKWFYEATRSGIKEFSQSILLSSTITCITWVLGDNHKGFTEFLEKYLRQFLESESFLSFQGNLRHSSILLKKSLDRRNIHPALPNLGTILSENGNPKLIIPQNYPVFFLNSLLKLLERIYLNEDKGLMNNLLKTEVKETLAKYLIDLSSGVNKKIGTNFLAKNEIRFVFKLLCFDNVWEITSKEVLLQSTYNLLQCMTPEHVTEIEVLFETVIFNGNNLAFSESVLSTWRQIYIETFIYPQRIIIPHTEVSLSMPCYQLPILPSDWPYVLLKSLLHKYLQQVSDHRVVVKDSNFPEHEVIRITFLFTSLLEGNGLVITSPTEKLMYLMIAFMGTESQFLDPDMKTLLGRQISDFFARYRTYKFYFDGIFEGKSKFENLYVLFLEHFQGASYGDDLFSSLVLVPLAQKYDSKWRKMVWSEHAAVLRFLNCDEDQLLGDLEAYLYPIETDVSLITTYARALNSNLLRDNTIPHKIAMHHVNNFKGTKT